MTRTEYRLLKARREVLWQRHAPTTRQRFELEWDITLALVRAALKTGYLVGLNNGEEVHGPFSSALDVMSEVNEVDEERLTFWKDGKQIGWVFLVYGNDGYDVISDYTTNMEELMEAPNKIADQSA